MESALNKKIIVALICQFSNIYIQNKIKIRKQVNDLGPWISSTIDGIKSYDNIELHIISPHDYLKSDTDFLDKNIHYHFFSIGVPIIHRHWFGFFKYDLWTKYKRNRKKIKNIIEKIDPDIIHLYGAENPYYSSSMLDLLDYNHIVTIQGFYYKELPMDANKWEKYRAKIEKDILSSANNFGVECSYMLDEINKLNPRASFFWHRIPVNFTMLKSSIKTFDILFFGRVTKQKGIEDFIIAIGVISKKYPNISVKIVGSIEEGYKRYLTDMAINNGCYKNIEFLGYIPTQEELHRIVIESKIYLFPTYNDTIPSTIIEAMSLNVAVIAYNTGGIPALCENEKTLELVRQGDINDLVQKTIYLLENVVLREEMQKRAFNFIQQNYFFGKPIIELSNIYKQLAQTHKNKFYNV